MAHKAEWDGAIPDRVSSSYGLMQVLFTTALQFGFPRHDPPEVLFQPLIGLQYGCRVLADRMAWAKGDVSAALASYNGGKTADNQPGVERKRNQVYVDSVLLWVERVRAGDVTG
jgi:soluble lytic murein transglycosylase-like protein